MNEVINCNMFKGYFLSYFMSNQQIMIELPAIQERQKSHRQLNKYDSPYIKGSNVPTKVFKRLVSILHSFRTVVRH